MEKSPKAIIDNRLRLYNLPTHIIEMFKRALQVENPKYEQEVSRLTWRLRSSRVSNAVRDKILAKALDGIPEFIKPFQEHEDGAFSVPRGCSEAVAALVSQVEVNIPPPPSIPTKSVLKLRDYQEKVIDDVLSFKFPFGLPGSGVIVAPAGSGKTAMGVELISRIGEKALWITHTSALAKQSLARFQQFMPDSDFGYIGGGKWKIGDITIALVQSLFRKDLTSIRDEFGIIIVDECHHVPANLFTTVVDQLNYRRIIGLSATPYRRDGLESLMFQYLGPVISRVEKKTLIDKGFLVPATIIQKKTGCSVGDLDYDRVLKALYRNEPRLSTITKDISKEASEGRVGIVLVDSISYGKKISERLERMGTTNTFVFSAKRVNHQGKLKTVESMSVKQRAAELSRFFDREVSVLIATYDLLAEGFDHAALDRLYMTIPISDKNRGLIEQVCGRVERPFEGKVAALVFDYVDDNRILLRQAKGRVPVYEENLMAVIEC